MNLLDNRRALQVAITVAGLVPVGAGLFGVLMGPALAGLGAHGELNAAGVSLDSHFRYMSGLLLGIGLVFWSLVPTIERQGALMRALGFIVVVGGMGRALSLIELGEPGSVGMRLAIGMELGVTPLLCLWQYRLETRTHRRRPTREAPMFSAPSRLS